jgi:hypothetical protein
MLHACLYTICFVFCYTSWRFYAFSRTNLLTRRHSASSMFLLFLCFRKATHEIFSELDETKAKIPIFPTRDEFRRWDGGAPEGGHTTSWRRPPPGRTMAWCGAPGPLPDAALPPIYPPRRENLKTRSIFHETYCKSPPSSMRDREGLEALPGTLPEREITTGGLLHHHGRLQSDVWVVYLGLRVHSSS